MAGSHRAARQRPGTVDSAVAGALGVAGLTAILYALSVQEVAARPTPEPPVHAAVDAGHRAPRADPQRASGTTLTAATLKLSPSEPVALDIPAIEVGSPLTHVGLRPDGTMEVPRGADYDRAAWYRHSRTPGEVGPAVIVGHIDSAERGPSVFFRLGELVAGDTISVARHDRTTAVFTVDAVRSYPKDDFPSREVYGSTDHAALRLITCGGDFDDQTNQYRDNIVVFAHLTDTARS